MTLPELLGVVDGGRVDLILDVLLRHLVNPELGDGECSKARVALREEHMGVMSIDLLDFADRSKGTDDADLGRRWLGLPQALKLPAKR